MKSILSNFHTCLLSLACLLAAPQLSGVQTGRLTYNDGTILGFLEYLPPEYSQNEDPLPLIIFLHGLGENAGGSTPDLSKLLRTGLPQVLQSKDIPFIVISPQVKYTWNATGPNLDAFLDYLMLRYPRIDAQRVYVTGLSDGGKGVFDFGLHHRDRIAAMVPVSSWPSDASSTPIPNEPYLSDPATPVWGFMGEEDSYGAMQNWIGELASAGGNAGFVLMPGGHSGVVWNTVYQGQAYDIYGWLLSHHRMQASTGLRPDAAEPWLIAYEGFDTATDSGLLQDTYGESSHGWNGNWIAGGARIVFPVDGDDGAVQAGMPGDALPPHRYLGTILGKRGTVYMHALIQPGAIPVPGVLGVSLCDDLRDTGLIIGLQNGGNSVSIWGSAVKSGPIGTGVELQAGQPVRVALELNLGGNTARAWVNPVSGPSAPATPTASFSLVPGSLFDRIALLFPDSGDELSLLDEISLSSTYGYAIGDYPKYGFWPVQDGWIDSSANRLFLGWMNVEMAPWLYNFLTSGWLYLPEDNISSNGAWAYFPAAN